MNVGHLSILSDLPNKVGYFDPNNLEHLINKINMLNLRFISKLLVGLVKILKNFQIQSHLNLTNFIIAFFKKIHYKFNKFSEEIFAPCSRTKMHGNDQKMLNLHNVFDMLKMAKLHDEEVKKYLKIHFLVDFD